MISNGWPGKPGVPMNPEEPGYHWVEGCDGENTIVFWRGHGGDTHHENGDLKYLDHWSGFPMWMAQDWTYLGPCLKPEAADEIEKLREALRVAMDAVEHWASYASPYAQEKHDLAGDLQKLRDALGEKE